MKVVEFFLGGVRGGLRIWALVGGVIAFCGLIALGICCLYLILGKRSSMRLIALHTRARKIDDDDDAEDIAEKKANPRYAEEFEIIGGKYQGVRVTSSSSSTKTHHEVGDVVKGYYIPLKGGDVMSAKSLSTGIKLGLSLLIFGLAILKFTSFIGSKAVV